MAKAFKIKNTGSGETARVVVSDEDAHWLRAYVYGVFRNKQRKGYARVTRYASGKVLRGLSQDIFGDDARVLHVNGDELDFRRSNVVVLNKSQMGLALNVLRHHGGEVAA